MHDIQYIDLMEKVLSAYTVEHIDRYYNDVATGGLQEQGFARLTANIGILIAHGRRTDLLERFVRMMDLCCEEIPKVKYASNEFSIKEIIFCFLELEKHRTLPQEQIDSWKRNMGRVTVENCYHIYATAPDSKVNNWAAFTMLSEWMRYRIGAAEEDSAFIDHQAASQLQYLDPNGMYRDPNEPMVYDLVTRGLFALLLHFGYRGKYFEPWDNALKRAGLLTLKMFSVTGEIPFGGRSNQFLHNEAHGAIVLEYEAARYAKLGDMETASRFKAGVRRALGNIELWLKQQPMTHIKNAYSRPEDRMPWSCVNNGTGGNTDAAPRKISYGCENYAYFDKYMITAASFLYVAYLFSDDSIPVGTIDDLTGESWQTTDYFHKVFLRAGEYFAEYDYHADYHYDASGLGRLHRKNAPGTICLSTPGSDHPNYAIDTDDAVPFAIVPEALYEGEWLSGAAPDAVHKVEQHGADGETAYMQISSSWLEKTAVTGSYLLDKNGMTITLEGQGGIGLMIPAFQFDGTLNPAIGNTGATLSIRYKGWECCYSVENGVIRDTGRIGCNRNGEHKLYRAEGTDRLVIRITIQPEKL